MKKKNIILCAAAGVVVVAAAAGVTAMKGSSGGDKQGMGGGPGGGPGGMGEMEQQTQTTVVRAEEPETGNIYLTTELTGTVEPDDVVHVYAKASGDITAVNVTAGDTVTKGQVLFTTRSRSIRRRTPWILRRSISRKRRATSRECRSFMMAATSRIRNMSSIQMR